MKKTILMSLALACATASFAQESATKQSGAYLRLGVGYAFPHAGDVYTGTTSLGTGSTSYDYNKGSFGAGFSGVLAAGYKFTPNIALELGVGVGIAPKKLEDKYSYADNLSTWNSTSSTYAKTPIYLLPAVVISTGNNLLEPYARVGLAVNVGGKLVQERTITGDIGGLTGTNFQKMEYAQRTGIGFQGALGVKYHINDMVGLWAEVAGISQNIYVKSSELTEYTENGVNKLDTKTTLERETNYEFNYTDNGSSNPNNPGTQAAFSNAFSNVGINLGVSFQF